MKNYSLVLNELSSLVDKIDEKEFNSLVDSIITAGHVFLAGAGRSGQMINAFANRMMHLGLSVSVVGEISSPHSRKNDLLIVGSGSGETQRLINQVKMAKNNGVFIALITTTPDSTLAPLADYVLIIPAGHSAQPMGSLFEQASLLTYDSIVLSLMANLNETSQTMKERHADIE
ncbi:SIS domain-containing protein [Salmonella enterica]|nr:SIS domain-containing protein [Salmonella enterica subsp. diarizonae]EGV3632798.1 SIS domain-containing protein [Salmonella enterica]EKL0440690.1 SIS domain-containing protein [Salmonella enterica]HCM1886179.1 SIS domain-containing protein [Salmonella enterica subsp. diarizonae serovar 57:c:z]